MTLPVVLKKWSEGVELPEVTSPEITSPERGSLRYAHAQLEVGVSRPFLGGLIGSDVTRSAKKMERGGGATGSDVIGSHVTPKGVPSGVRKHNRKLVFPALLGVF